MDGFMGQSVKMAPNIVRFFWQIFQVGSFITKYLDHVYLRHLSTEYQSILSANMSTDSRPGISTDIN